MSTQLLVNVLPVGPLAAGASVTLAHNLASNDVSVAPTLIIPDRITPIAATVITTTTVTFTNGGAAIESANFRCERGWQPEVDAFSVTPMYWQGGPVGAGGAPVSAEYLTLAPNGTLTQERVFTPSARLVGVDGGAGNPYTLDLALTAVVPGSYSNANITVDAYGRLTAAATGSSSLASLLKMGNTVVVDQVNGNDATGVVNGLPFQTVSAATTYVASLVLPPGGVTIWVLPGTYVLTSGITVTANCSIRGLSLQTTRLSWDATVPGGTATMLTLGENARVEDLTLLLTSTDATTNLVGIQIAGLGATTDKLRSLVLSVNNSTVPTGSTTNVYGILSSGTSPLSPTTFSFNVTRAVSINVYSNGGGNKRGVLVNAANGTSCRDTVIYVAAPTDPLSTGSYVGAETTDNLAQAAFRGSSISGPLTAGGYTGSDVLQTLPAVRDTYGISIGPGTDLIHRTTQGKPFALTTTPAILAYAINAVLLGAPRYLWPGVLPTGGDSTEVFFRFDRIVLIQGMSVNMRTPPGVGNNVVFTVRKSATGVPGSGVATTMTVTVSDLATTGINLTSAVTVEAGEYISLRADRSAVGAADIAIQLDLY